MIDSYSFGKMTINGKKFRRDLIILPDGTALSPWQEVTAMGMSSKQAAQEFNSLAGASNDVTACFHLTC